MMQTSHGHVTSVRPLAAAIAALFLATGSLSVQAADIDRVKELESRLEQSLKVIEALTTRVGQLETRSTKAAAAPAAGQADPRVAALEQSVANLSESLSKRSSDTGLPLHGFLDVGFGSQSGINAANYPGAMQKNGLRGFNGGTLDFYLTPQFGSRVKTLVELAFEYSDAGSLAADLERAQIGYTFGESNTLWLGRFHTPYGYWNTGFHHGAQLQTAINRPRFIDFEDKGGLLPSHSVGMWLNGKTAAGDGRLTYDLYVTNGNRIMAGANDKVLNLNGFTDDNGSKAIGFNVGYEWKNGLKLGLHGFRDAVNTYAGADADTSQILNRNKVGMLGGYAFYDNNDWEVIGEYYRWKNNTDLDTVGVVGTTGSHTSSAGFLQVGYSFGSQWTPYARYEKASLDNNDIFFNSLNNGRSYDRASLGLRYALDPRSALKFELSRTNEKPGQQLNTSGTPAADVFGSSAYSTFQAQYSIGF